MQNWKDYAVLQKTTQVSKISNVIHEASNTVTKIVSVIYFKSEIQDFEGSLRFAVNHTRLWSVSEQYLK